MVGEGGCWGHCRSWWPACLPSVSEGALQEFPVQELNLVFFISRQIAVESGNTSFIQGYIFLGFFFKPALVNTCCVYAALLNAFRAYYFTPPEAPASLALLLGEELLHSSGSTCLQSRLPVWAGTSWPQPPPLSHFLLPALQLLRPVTLRPVLIVAATCWPHHSADPRCERWSKTRALVTGQLPAPGPPPPPPSVLANSQTES